MVKGKKSPGPFTSEDDEEPTPPPPEPIIPIILLTTALGIEEPPIGVVTDEESHQFRAALARRIAQLQVLRDDSPIIDNPLGLIDIAPRVDLPLGDQSSSRSPEMRVIPQPLCPSSPVPSDSDMSISRSKSSRIASEGGNPRKTFSSNSSITTMKGPKSANNNANNKIGSRPQQAEYWGKDSDSSDEEVINKYSKKNPCNKMVKRIHYQRNTTVLISEVDKYIIDINTPDKLHRLRMLHSVLSTTGFLTLIEGHRTEPIMTEENVQGFSERKIILVTRLEYEDEKSLDSSTYETMVERLVLEEDDAFHYIHDNDRLFSLVYIMFAKTLHHNISIRNQKLRNGIESSLYFWTKTTRCEIRYKSTGYVPN